MKNGSPQNGENGIFNTDDEYHEIPLTKNFPYGQTTTNKFWITANGDIHPRTTKPTFASNILNDKPWKDFPGVIYAYQHDGTTKNHCTAAGMGCGMFWRKGDNDTLSRISSILESGNMAREWIMNAGKRFDTPSSRNFVPDPELTVVMTWYEVRSHGENTLHNTFQAVLTSDGSESYVIFSYEDLQAPTTDSAKWKMGVSFTATEYCRPPIDTVQNYIPSAGKRSELMCQSNVYRKGTYVFGLTSNSFPKCMPGKDELKLTCADCDDNTLNKAANEPVCSDTEGDKICGTDKREYNSICFLRRAACSAFNGTVSLNNKGKCYVDPCLSAGCEDTCEVYGPNKDKARCKCSDGKQLRNDGKSCDWMGYFYQGSRNMIILSKGNMTHVIQTEGEVRAVQHDYSTNTLFFSTEDKKNGNWEYKIRSYHPSNKEKTILEDAGGQVTHMLFDPTESSLYYALSNGQIKMVKNLYGDEAKVATDVYKFEKVGGMHGEGCKGMMFVLDSQSGTVNVLDQEGARVIVSGLSDANALGIDHMHHKLYWYSSTGIEESNFDGTCRRIVSKMGMSHEHPPVFMNFFYDGNLYWGDGKGSLLSMNLKTGAQTTVYSNAQYITHNIGVIYPDFNRVRKNMMDRTQMSGQNFKFGKEFQMSFKMRAVDKAVSLISTNGKNGKNFEITYDRSNFIVNFEVNNDNNYRVEIPRPGPAKAIEWEIGQEKLGHKYRFYIRMNGEIVHTVINKSPKDFGDRAFMAEDASLIREFELVHRDFKPHCPIKYTCGDVCKVKNGGCEDTCYSDGTESKCLCSDGKRLKADGKSCDWRGFFFTGSENALFVSNGINVKTIAVSGKVTAITSDYSTNTVFYATEVYNSDAGKTEFAIYAFTPKHEKFEREQYRVVYGKSSLTQKVTSMMFAADKMNVGIFYATADGNINYLENIYASHEANNSMVVDTFSSVTAMAGESCSEYMFVMEQDKIYVFNKTTPAPFKPVISGLKNGRGLTIDYARQMMYWSSDNGIEESRYDGSCRRNVTRNLMGGKVHSMVFTDTLYWTNEMRYNGKFSVMKTDVSTGRSDVVGSNDLPLGSISFVWPATAWKSAKRVHKFDKKVMVDRIDKEYKLSFYFESKNTHDYLQIPYDRNVNVDFPRPGLTVSFNMDGGRDNFTIPTMAGKKHFIEIMQQREGVEYRFYIRADNKVLYTAVNSQPDSYSTREIMSRSREGHRVEVHEFNFHSKASGEVCKKHTACPVYCSANTCEEKCTVNTTMPGHDSCSCSDGKKVKSDMRSCDWKDWNYFAGDHFFTLSRGNDTRVVLTKGKVITMTHDYSTNTLYYSQENSTGFSIESYNPKTEFKTIASGLSHRVDYMAYDQRRQELFFTHGKDAMHIEFKGKKTVELMGTFSGKLTGMTLEPCKQIMFVAIGSKNQIWEFDANGMRLAINNTNNPQGVQIDHEHYKLIWTSEEGFEESSLYEYNCTRRILEFPEGRSAVQMRNMSFHFGYHYNYVMWGNSSSRMLIATDIQSGVSTHYPSQADIYDAGLIYNQMEDREHCPVSQPKCDLGFCDSNKQGYGCEEECHTVAGKARCFCSSGAFKPDGKHCDYSGFMVYGHNYGINMAKSTTKYINLQVNGDVYGVDFNYKRNHVFLMYSDGPKNLKIGMLNAQGSPHTHLYTDASMNGKYYGGGYLAFDYHTHDMYFSNDERVSVKRDIYNNTDNQHEIIYEGMTRGIAFDTCGSTLYFIMAENNTIRSWKNGAYEDIYTYGHHHENISTLTIDHFAQKLFFWEGHNVIEMSFNGSCKRVVATVPDVGMPYGLQVFSYESVMYWTDSKLYHDGYRTYMNNLKTGETSMVFASPLRMNQINGIFDIEHLAPCSYNGSCSKCMHNNGGCEDKCYHDYKDNKAKCTCAAGHLRPDGKTCDMSNYTVFAQDNAITLSYNATTYTVVPIMGKVRGIEFDYRKNKIFYSVGNKLYMFGLDGKPEWLHTEYDNINHLAYDEERQNLYYATNKHVSVMNNVFNKTMRMATNLTEFKHITGIVLDTCVGKIFVTCSGCKILAVLEMGKPMEKILTGLDNPRSLSIDQLEKKLYFFNGDTIMSTNYDGSCKSIVAKGFEAHEHEPFSMEAVGFLNSIYWIDYKKEADGNYYMYNTDMQGKTTVLHKDQYQRGNMKIIYDRKSFVCTATPGHCVLGACRINNGGCENTCAWKDFKVQCSCENTVLKPDMKHCDYNGFIGMSQGKQVILTDMQKPLYFPTESGTEALAIEFTYEPSTIFYTVKSEGLVPSRMYSIDGKGKHTLLYTSTRDITHLAYDHAKHEMYFVSDGYLKRLYFYWSKTPQTIGYFHKVNGIAFEPCQDKVYVACEGSPECGVVVVDRNMGRMKLPGGNFHHVKALAMDIVKHKLYVFQNMRGITETNYDGSCRKHVANHSKPVMPNDMTYTRPAHELLWSGKMKVLEMYPVMKTNLNNGETERMMQHRVMTNGLMQVFDRKFKATCKGINTCASGVCAYQNGGCEHICSDMQGSVKCSCKYGSTLREDGKTCDFSRVAYSASGRYLVFNYGEQFTKTEIFHRHVNPISAITHDAEKKGIFFACKGKDGSATIYFKRIGQNDVMTIWHNQYQFINSMAYDQSKVSDTLYYARQDGAIHRIHNPLDSDKRRDEFVYKAGDPHYLTLDYCSREMIFIDMMNGFGKAMKIKEGDQVADFINYGMGHLSIHAFDRKRNNLYWYCSATKTIREVNSGYTCERTVGRAESLKSMVFRDMKLYYTDAEGNVNVIYLRNSTQHHVGKTRFIVTAGMKMFYDGSSLDAMAGGKRPDSEVYNPRTAKPMASDEKETKPTEKTMTRPTGVPAPGPTVRPEDEQGYTKGADGYSYKYYARSMNWAEAHEVCRKEGAHLATIDSPATLRYVSNMIKMKQLKSWIWVGGQDKDSNNSWTWTNGMPIGKDHWYPGEPNNFNNVQEDCTAIFSEYEGRLFDAHCSWDAPHFLCQKGGYMKGPDGQYFKFHDEKMDWNKASASCKEEGAHLAVVDNQATFDFLKKSFDEMKVTNFVWIGGNDKYSNNSFKWVNGKSVGKSNWQMGEPNNYNGFQEDCMLMYPVTGSTFYDAHCMWADPSFVCQRSVKPHKPTDDKLEGGYRQMPNGHYYKYFAEPKTYDEAQAACVADRGMLAIDDSEHTHHLISMLFPQNFWHGANDKNREGDYRFVDGRVIKNPFWDHKNNDGKDDDEEDCVYMRNGRWAKEECDHKMPYLCQRKGEMDQCGTKGRCPKQVMYPFGPQFGDMAVPRGDETFAHLEFEHGIPFFSRLKKDIYIHTNGLITADRPDGRWNITTESKISRAGLLMMDLTTEHGGNVFYRVTTDAMVLGRIAFEMSKDHTIPKGYKPTYAMIVTWNEVSSKKDPSKKFTFQLISHTDGVIFADNSIYVRVDEAGAWAGYSEGKCNQYWTRVNREMVHYSTIGIPGIYTAQLSKSECGIMKKSEALEVKYQPSDPSMQAAQSFYFNGKDKIVNVFTQSYTWNFPSVSFTTELEHKLDETHVKYVYYSNAAMDYKWGVSTLVLRDNLNVSSLRHGHMKVEMKQEGRQCQRHHFKRSMEKAPKMLLNVMIKQSRFNPLNGLSTVWLHNVNQNGFDVCYKGMVDFWGPRSISIGFMAATDKSHGATEMDTVEFDEGDQKSGEVFCKDVKFDHFYPYAPAVFVTPEETDNRDGKSNGEIMAWVKDVKRSYTTICARSKWAESAVPMKVHYFVYGEMDQCSTFKCPGDQECRLDVHGKPSCGCKQNCTEYVQGAFCASNMHTYASECEAQKHMCEAKQNMTELGLRKVHDGSCKQFPYQTGKTSLQLEAGLKSVFCKDIGLNEYNFFKHYPVHVLLTVTWDKMRSNESNDATASWTENVQHNRFKACVMVAGRHFFDNLDAPSVHWVAYQSGVATGHDLVEVGAVQMKTWYTGSRCQFIRLKKYTPETNILVSVEHSKERSYKNAMTAWVEKGAMKMGPDHLMKVCARELQNFDGIHEGIKINYMAVHGKVDKYIVEPNELHFRRQHFERDQPIPPVCQTKEFNMDFPKLSDPTIILTAINRSSLHTKSIFSPHDIAVWLEGNNNTHFTACFKSLRAGIYREEVAIQYNIFPNLNRFCEKNWRFFDGKCISPVQGKENHTTAARICAEWSSALPKNLGDMKEDQPWKYYLEKSMSGPMWVQHDKNNSCAMRFDSGEMAVSASENCTHDEVQFYCVKNNIDLLKKGCNCMNGGSCHQKENNVYCDCPQGFGGKRCEKRVQVNCMNYKNITNTMLTDLHHNVWYRYHGMRMVEYCPRRAGCASMDEKHPEVRDGVVTRNLVYGNFPLGSVKNCMKGYGKVMVQNCGDYYVYNIHSVARKEMGNELCFERERRRIPQ